MRERLGDREAAVAREITKLHEECVTGTLAELAERYADAPPKGEIVIVVGPPPKPSRVSDEELDAALDEALGAPVAVARRGRGRRAARSAAQARLRPRARAVEVNRQAAEKRGRGAETLACWYLRLHGWRILARRARVPGGEVDIVARRGRTLAFVEVKARASEDAAAFALDD